MLTLFQEEIWFSDCEDDPEKIAEEIVINDDIYEALISEEVSFSRLEKIIRRCFR